MIVFTVVPSVNLSFRYQANARNVAAKRKQFRKSAPFAKQNPGKGEVFMNENTFRKATGDDTHPLNTQSMFNEPGESRDDSGHGIPPSFANRAQRFGEIMTTFHSGTEGKTHIQRMEAFGTQIRRLRTELNLRRSDLAQATGLTEEFLFCLEHGMLTIAEINSASPLLAQALGIPQADFDNEIELISRKESDHE